MSADKSRTRYGAGNWPADPSAPDPQAVTLERGRQLASERDDLIAQGVDPAELVVPIAPVTVSHVEESDHPVYAWGTVEDLHSRLACVLEATYWDRPYDERMAAIRGMCDLTTNGMSPAEAREASPATAALARVEALYGGEPPPVFIVDTKIVRVTSYRRDLGCDVTTSMLRVGDVRAAIRGDDV